MEILKVASNTNVAKLAGAIAGIVEDGKSAELRAVGAGAVNTAMKSLAVARGYVAPKGMELVCAPGFLLYEENGAPRTLIRLIISDMNRR